MPINVHPPDIKVCKSIGFTRHFSTIVLIVTKAGNKMGEVYIHVYSHDSREPPHKACMVVYIWLTVFNVSIAGYF